MRVAGLAAAGQFQLIPIKHVLRGLDVRRFGRPAYGSAVYSWLYPLSRWYRTLYASLQDTEHNSCTVPSRSI